MSDNIRHSVVAGSFYPKNSSALMSSIETLLKESKEVEKYNTFGVICPHAGYIYSGLTAAKVLRSIKSIPELVIILSPNHTGMGEDISIHPAEAWETPIGEVKVSTEASNFIVDKSSANFDVHAHTSEHSLEVILPFLKVLNSKLKIVPITVKPLEFSRIEKLSNSIASILKDYYDKHNHYPLLIASSDMTHFESSDSARQKDMLAIKEIENLDPQGLIETVYMNDISMCGVFPSAILINTINKLNKNPKVSLVSYTNSGEISEDYSSVVAYAGINIHE
jgi:AmmeMemoRadiSam system protein B